MNEWKEVQDKIDEQLVSISLGFNEPLSYSIKCNSDFHSRPLTIGHCHCFELKELEKTWEEYLQVGKLTPEMKSNYVIKAYKSYTSYDKNIPEVDFMMPQSDLEKLD